MIGRPVGAQEGTRDDAPWIFAIKPRYTALPSGKIGLMPKHLSAEDIFPLVGCPSPDDRLRLLRFISARPAADDRDIYGALPPRKGEFSSEEDLLAWYAEG